MSLKLVIQAILLIWFLAISVAILVPSYQLLFGSDDANASRPQPPAPPQPPSPVKTAGPLDQAPQLEAYKQQIGAYAEQIKGYTQEVSGYTQQLAAYKAHQEATDKSSRRGVYELVVKGSLIVLLGSFVTALIAYVFANLGAGVVNNVSLLKNGRDPQPLTLL
jgi:hypothetical protein